MSIVEVLYTIIIYPLELLFEVIFYLANSVISNPGLSIVVLSLAVNFLVLPLYIRADVLQKEERDIELRLKHWVDHIKRNFKGDERFMMLQAYYRENDYKPVYVFRSTLPLLLQIPFFIAALRFLSGLSVLKGFEFGPINDMGSPDAMLTFYGFSINVLPILMTLINIISGTIYTKGSPVKEKVQLYGIALIFMILLYRSPAGLVFYWTLNNLFSLVKNVFYKFNNPKAVLCRIVSYVGVMLFGFVLALDGYSSRQRIFLVIICIMLQFPIILMRFIKKNNNTSAQICKPVYFLSALLSAVVIGGLIPSTVVASSTAEFIDIIKLNNPVEYIAHSFCIAVGFFLVWMSVFYLLADKKGKILFEYAMWPAVIIFIVDYMFFGTDLGNLSFSLKFDTMPSYSYRQYIINILVMVLLLIICYVCLKKSARIVTTILISAVLVSTVMTVYNIVRIEEDYTETVRVASLATDTPIITLSKNEKNVIVIMMDRMIPGFIPFIMEEDPLLYKSFDGFTYYSNTVSFGTNTNSGAPGLFGGYEYVPEEMNKRDTELLVDKNNEALKVMPVIFGENGMDVTVFDPVYAGYGMVPDLSIYDDYPYIKKYITMGNVQDKGYDFELVRKKLNRNFFFYSIFKSVPLFLQRTVYNGGNYNSTNMAVESESGMLEITGQSTLWLSQSHGIDENFMKSYSVMDSLVEMTKISDTDKGCFLMMSNCLTHEPMILKEPEYEPAMDVDNREYDETHLQKYDAKGNLLNLDDKNYVHEDNLNKVKHYQVNMCAMKKLGKFFDYLKEQGVYDNTRIIIASDHSTNLLINRDYVIEGLDENGNPTEYDCERFNCTLMFKDFKSTGYVEDEEFMTNADVPTLAFEGIINEPFNPFTGKIINSNYKNENELKLINTTQWRTSINNGYRFLPEAWISVHDNVHDRGNWKFIEYK